MPAELEIIQKFILSLMLGGLIGIERERNIAPTNTKINMIKKGFGGVRTFSLICLLGTLSAYTGKNFSSIFYAFGFIILGLFLVESYLYFAFKLRRGGVTSEISAVITFLIGVTIFGPDVKIPITLAIALAVILTLKKPLHQFAWHLNGDELYATLKFAIIAFVVLPYLPNKTIDPWNLFNPHKIWLFVVIISAITFLGYILNKILGVKKGLFLTGFLGGLVSSTSVIGSTAKKHQKNSNLNIVSGLITSLISYLASAIKVAITIFLLNINLIKTLIAPICVLLLTGTLLSFYLYLKNRSTLQKATEVNFKNPFTLSFAVQFGLIVSCISILSELSLRYLGNNGIIITSILAGIAKIDTIAVSMAEMAGTQISYQLGAQAIMIGLFFSAFSKSIYGYLFGGKNFGQKISFYLLIPAVLSVLTSIFLL